MSNKHELCRFDFAWPVSRCKHIFIYFAEVFVEVISITAAGEVNVQCFHEIDERQDDKILLE